MLLNNKKVILSLILSFTCLFSSEFLIAADKNKEASQVEQEKAMTAYNAKMYKYSIDSFQKALEYDRSNYDAMLYLAKVHYYLKDYKQASKVASSLASSFYPEKDLKIEAFQLLADVAKKEGKGWHALAYLYAAADISTSVDMSHLVKDQMAKLNLDEMDYPSFDDESDSIITSKNMMYVKGSFVDVSSDGRFEPVSFSVKKLNSKFVIVAGFDNRLRFNKLLVIKILDGVPPKIIDVAIQKKKRGGSLGTKDLYVKIMDWNFDAYPDLVVRVSGKKSNVKQAFLIFNPKSSTFEVNEELSALADPILDRTSKSVIEESCDKKLGCVRKRYKLFNRKYALTQFEKNICAESCIYTNAEIDVSSLRSTEHMYLVSTIETEFEQLQSKFSSSSSSSKKSSRHTIVTKRVLNAYYSTNYDVNRRDKAIMTLDLDGSWEFPASYVKNWVSNYFSRQPLDGQLGRKVLADTQKVITKQ